MSTEQIMFEPGGFEALNKLLMNFLRESPAEDSSRRLTPEEKSILASAAEAYKAGHYQVAVTHYKTCVSSISKTYIHDNKLSQEDVVLQYMLSKCLNQSQQFQDLIEARTILAELEISVGKVYPMIYYGLSESYVKIFCFDEAEQFITKGFAVVKESTKFPDCYIPETNDLIPESTKQDLTEKLLNLKEQCSGWHPPDAKCFMDICTTVSPNHICGKNIFIKSPAYNGMVTLTCSNAINPCTITFHSVCWKIKKDEVSLGMKISEKEIILNWMCLTPNCGDENEPSVIRKITIHKEDGGVKCIEPTVEKFNRNTQQQSSASKGAIRKQKLMNKTSTPKAPKVKPVFSNNNSINASNNNYNHSNHHNSQVNHVSNNTNIKNNSLANEALKGTVKNPEPQKLPSLIDPAAMKLMKMISLREANFNIEFENDWRPDEAYYDNEHMRSTIDSSYEPDFSNDPDHVAHIKSFLFSYFISYIENRGPIKNDELIKEWHEITESIGGCETIVNDLNNVDEVRQFLLQSLRFVAIGDYICIPALLPGAYALVQANVHHRVMNMLEKGDRNVDSKNKRKSKRERKISVSECNTGVKEKIIKKEAEDITDDKIPDRLEEDGTSTEDKFLLCADDFLDTSGSDQEDCAATGSSTGSSLSYHSPIQGTDVKNDSERTGVEQHATKIEGNEMIEDDEVREKPFEIQEEGIERLEAETSNNEEEGEDSADGYETDDTEKRTSEESSGRAEEVLETDRASQGETVEAEVDNVPEEPKTEEGIQDIEEEEAIDADNPTQLESVQSVLVQKTDNHLQQTSDDYQAKSSNVSERYVIESESEEAIDEQEDLSPGEGTEICHPIELLTAIEEEDSSADDENKDQGDYEAQRETEDADSSCSSTIDEVMNEFIKMSSNKPQSSKKTPEPSKSDVIAEQAAVIKELAEELKTTQDNLEKKTKELENMKMKMLKKSLDAQYSSNHTLISCKMEATRSDYAIIAKLQKIVFKTIGSYLNIDWQDWTMPLDKLEKIRSSLQDEYAKLASMISSKKGCEDMDDVRLNMLNVPTSPQHKIPDLIEVACSTMKNRIQQPMVSQPPLLPPQNPHVPPMMSFWYQQTQFLQQALPHGPYHHLTKPMVPPNQMPTITSAQYPPSTVAMVNRSPSEMAQSVFPKRYSTTKDQNANRVSWSNLPKPHAPKIPTEHENVSAPVASKESSNSEARKETSETKPVRTTPPPKPANEGWKQAFPESCNSGQSKFSNALNNTQKLKTCTPTVLSNGSLSSPKSRVKIIPKCTNSNKTQIPLLTKSQLMNLPVKTAQTKTIKTEKRNLLLGQYEFAKPLRELTAQEAIKDKTQIPPFTLKQSAPLEAKVIIEDVMKKRTEIPTQKPKILQKELVREEPGLSQSKKKASFDSNEKKDSAQVIPVSDEALINRFLSKNAAATSETPVTVPANDSSPSTSKVAESIKAEDAPTSLPNVPIKKSAPAVIEEKVQPRPIQEVNSDRSKPSQTGQSKIDQRAQKNAAIQQSVKCEKPSTSGQVPIVNGRSEVKTPEQPKIHSADKLMYILRKKHEAVLEYDLLYSVQIVRKNHNDTLSGLSLLQIVEEASQVINERQKLQLNPYLPNNGRTNKKNQSFYVTVKSERPRNDSISSTSSVNSIQRELTTKMNPWNKPQDVSWRKDSPELECVICMEVLITHTNEPMYTLKCQHTFHKQCIKNWFTQNQSCPTCRIHSTIDDEFPPLA